MSTPIKALYVLTLYDTFQEILQDCPRVGELLAEYGLHCASCSLNEYDTLETGAKMHGMTEDEMIDMLDEINEEIEKEWRAQGGKK